jgi:peptidoglycan hydrolase-like protein with peptidoglycan-binding domain
MHRSARGLLTALVVLLLVPAAAVAATGPSEPSQGLPGWSAGPARQGVGFFRVAGSRRVREVQRLLVRSGYRPGVVDGRFGPRTEAAVLEFQFRHGLRRSGIVGSRTLLLLRSRARAGWPAGWAAGPVRRGSGYSRADGSDRVRELQSRLNRLGYHSGPVDGLFGPRTERAVLRFQRRHHLEVDGVVGMHTLRSLGLLHPAASRPRAGSPAPRGQAPAAPRPTVEHRHGPEHLPTGLVLAILAAIGLIAAAVSYARTEQRLRKSRQRAAQRALAEHRRRVHARHEAAAQGRSAVRRGDDHD